jgi:hypothetical protein
MKRSSFTGACVALGFALATLMGASFAAAEPPRAELHVWGGNEADDSSAFGLRTVEAALWPTEQDRFAVRYDNSLSLDNPTLARTGVDAEAYFISYLHNFNGSWLAQVEVGRRDLPGDTEQDIYKLELVFFNNGAAAKFGAQVSPTDTPLGDYTDTVVWGMYNFAVSEHWRVEPAIYLSETGAAGDREWRLAGYAEYNPDGGHWQLGAGAGVGDIDSDVLGASGEVFNAHARLTWNITENHSLHAQVRYEDAPLEEYTVGLVGFSLRLPR